MVRRELFAKLGGFDERLAIVNNDVDFCLRARQAGYLVVWTPYAVLYHHEMASRNVILEPSDVDFYWNRWRGIHEEGDPYYNPNLSLQRDDFRINKQPVLIEYGPWPMIEPERIRKILVIKLDHLGDVILALPAIRRLRQLFPNAEITALVGTWAKSLLEREPAIDKVLTFDFFDADSSRPPKVLTAKQKATIKRWLAQFNFDLAIDLRRHSETREFLLLSSAKYTVGFAREGEYPWLTIAIPYDLDTRGRRPRRHIAQELITLVELIALMGAANVDNSLRVESSEVQDVNKMFDKLLPKNSTLVVGMHPGVGQKIRQWPLNYFAQLADLFIERLSANVLFFGGAQDIKYVDEILEKMRNGRGVVSVAGKLTLSQFLAAVKHCDLFIGNNTGPTHMAAALGIPTLGIYAGTNDPREWAPIGRHAAAIYVKMPCSPCYLVQAKDCPYGVSCLSSLRPAKVFEAAIRILLPKWTKCVKKQICQD